MTTENPADTLRSWLRAEIGAILKRKLLPPPFMLWCDPDQSWRELLRAAAEGGAFELWCDEDDQLILRDRLLDAPAAPRVVYLPVGEDGITFLKVLELQAEKVWRERLADALARFGVELAPEQRAALTDLLPAHAREWIDRPRSAWVELTPGNAKGALVDDDLVLRTLARSGVPITELVPADRVGVFRLRVTEDFGLPAPGSHDDDWRAAATARLLVTEAAVRVPGEPPDEVDRIIPAGPPRDRALKLLDRWLKDIELMPLLDDIVRQADAMTSLGSWARRVSIAPPPLASRAAEDALVQREIDHLDKLEDFDGLARRLEEREPFYTAHQRGFWGSRAGRPVPWQSLVMLARAGATIRQHFGAEKEWATPADAVAWFTLSGWQVDQQGEELFREHAELPAALHAVRARLRRGYLRHVDSSNAAFSELVHRHGLAAMGLAFAGEVLAQVHTPKDPLALLVLDACRYDLGQRLANLLNAGEPARRTETRAARAPLPSITALGMPFALADSSSDLKVEVTESTPSGWRVWAPGVPGDLTAAEARREWLRRRFKLKPVSITDVKAVLDQQPPTPREAGRLIVVFGDEFDTQGHEGELMVSGAEEYIERYVRVIRRLRDSGYGSVAVVTDHGFVQWAPDKDEVEALPTGEVLWKSRRAVVGRALKHPTALAVPVVGGGDLECRVPRSVNSFRTYGKTGFFHGGATLQELVIPVVVARWPRKAEKIAVVLTPISAIVSLRPRVELHPGATGLPGVGPEPRMMSREVVVKVVEPRSGRRLFASTGRSRVEPDGEPVTVLLERAAGETCTRGARLHVEVRDADNDGLLDRCDVELKVDLEEWD